MHRDYTKICRVCMADGSRDIFHKNVTDGSAAAMAKTATPLERLLEKLRYVTMMKIEETDDLPRLLCDLCIVQLNVAYNFKRQAVENDTRLRQYFIESGISSNQISLNIETPSMRSSFAASNISQPHQSFPIVPLIVKTEPHDIDGFSDATNETNVEIDNQNRFQTSTSIAASSPEEPARRTNDSIYINDNNPSSMVFVNRGYEFNSVTPSSDIEFVQNYQNNTTYGHRSVRIQNKSSVASANIKSNENPITPVSRNNNISTQRKESKENGIRKIKLNMDNRRKSSTLSGGVRKTKVSPREVKNLEIDMLPETIRTFISQEPRRTSGKTKRVLPGDDKATVDTLPIKIKTTNSPVPTKRLASAASMTTKESLSSKNSARTTSFPSTRTTTEQMILINPFNSTENTNKLKTIKKSKLDNRGKRKTTEKLLRPKLEPPSTKKN